MKAARVIKHQQRHLRVAARKAVACDAFGAVERFAQAVKQPDAGEREGLRVFDRRQKSRPGRRNGNVAEITDVETEGDDEDPEFVWLEPALAPEQGAENDR